MAKNKTDVNPLCGQTNNDEKAKAPPQSKAMPKSSNKKLKGGKMSALTATNETHKRDDEDSDIAALTKGLGDVSIGRTPNVKEPNVNVPEEIQRVASLLASNKHKNIVILTGAGVSCSAGIPDFRTPGTGLYDNLQKYNLPFPEAVFDLGFYRRNPDPFIQLASELWPGKHSPTITHSFIALLEKKGMLLRTYTQNIDGLDVLAGVSEEKMIECHGHFRTASCISCNVSYDGKECKRVIVEEKRAPPCQNCGGHVKPDIVFFGESLPTVFHRNVKKDTKNADLLIVMGTSLMVGPVNQIPEMVRKDCPRILFNNELVGSFRKKNGPSTRKKSYNTNAQRDIFHEGDCDSSVQMLCNLLGWEQELNDLNYKHRLG
mmetsp:Transcript_28692/g.52369  ORF Transcript_28692/g.52369 Transcript_28692/m.52369 type:complete len:374 (-) Transcript_28692:241-1362(-)